MKSNQLAMAAASGAGVETPTVADILQKTAGRGEFLTEGDIYNGQAAALSDQEAARLYQMQGNAAMTGGLFDAAAAATGYSRKSRGWDSTSDLGSTGQLVELTTAYMFRREQRHWQKSPNFLASRAIEREG
jgi:hypothetical protein